MHALLCFSETFKMSLCQACGPSCQGCWISRTSRFHGGLAWVVAKRDVQTMWTPDRATALARRVFTFVVRHAIKGTSRTVPLLVLCNHLLILSLPRPSITPSLPVPHAPHASPTRHVPLLPCLSFLSSRPSLLTLSATPCVYGGRWRS
jgi:hypothetical protein